MPQALINTDALKHNLAMVRKLAPASRVMAVIKADAYGHSTLAVTKALSAADAFAVARIDEALKLRAEGVQSNIIVLGGVYSEYDLKQAIEQHLEIVIHQHQQFQMLNDLDTQSLKFWLKFDTGMGRLGFNPDEYSQLILMLQENNKLEHLIGILSHLANADDSQDDYSKIQLAHFKDINVDENLQRSMANSAAIMAWPETHFDWVRPGLMLYGVSPLTENDNAIELKPVMQFQAEIISIKECQTGDKIGYGGRFTCPEDMKVGVVSVGYGDGYPREMPDGCPVLVNGQTVPLVGQVSMDMLTIDLRTLKNVNIGDKVVLWGDGLPVDMIAKQAGTIAYTLLCGIAKRVNYKEVTSG